MDDATTKGRRDDEARAYSDMDVIVAEQDRRRA